MRSILRLFFVLLMSSTTVGAGTISVDPVNSSLLGLSVNVGVYLPDSYATHNVLYPVVYYLPDAGRDHTEINAIALLLDNMLVSGELEPMIVVVPDATDGNFIVSELIPHIDATYRTRTDRYSRGLAGHGVGATNAMRTVLEQSSLFCSVAVDAGDYTGLSGAEVADLRTLFFSCGVNNDAALYQAALAYSNQLATAGIEHEFIAHAGDHTSLLQAAQETMFEKLSISFSFDNHMAKDSVTFLGSGKIVMQESASLLIDSGRILSIESCPNCQGATNITWELRDNAKLQVGNDSTPGGIFQVGNPQPRGASIDFNLILDGQGAKFEVDRQGFFGLGACCECERHGRNVPDHWVVGSGHDLNNVSLIINEGTFEHNKIVAGDDMQASLIAFGDAQTFSFKFDPNNARIFGGGNIVYLDDVRYQYPQVSNRVGYHVPRGIYAYIAGTDSVTHANKIKVSLLASKTILQDTSKGAQPTAISAEAAFDYLSLAEYTSLSRKQACATQSKLGQKTIAYVHNGEIIRRAPVLLVSDDQAVISKNLAINDSTENKGAVGIMLSSTEPRVLIDVVPLG